MIKFIIYLSRFDFINTFLSRLLYEYTLKLEQPAKEKQKVKAISERMAQEHLSLIVRREKKGIPVNVIPMPRRRGLK